MSNKGKFEYTTTTDKVQVADYLNRIAEGLRVGTLSMAADTRTINLAPNGDFKLEIGADSNQGKGRGSIVVEISWKAGAESPCRALEISTQPHAEDEAVEAPPADDAGENGHVSPEAVLEATHKSVRRHRAGNRPSP